MAEKRSLSQRPRPSPPYCRTLAAAQRVSANSPKDASTLVEDSGLGSHSVIDFIDFINIELRHFFYRQTRFTKKITFKHRTHTECEPHPHSYCNRRWRRPTRKSPLSTYFASAAAANRRRCRPDASRDLPPPVLQPPLNATSLGLANFEIGKSHLTFNSTK